MKTILIVALLALLLAGCDADGDGLDDTTEQPVPTRTAGADGCGPGGVPWLCGGGENLDPEVDPEWMAMVARHEAGHVAVARHYGWKITSARVYSNGSGRVNVWGFAWKDPHQRLVFLYAGALAAGTEQGTEGDYDQAGGILADFPAGGRDEVERSARDEASRIVAERAGEIERDAARLLDRGRL